MALLGSYDFDDCFTKMPRGRLDDINGISCIVRIMVGARDIV